MKQFVLNREQNDSSLTLDLARAIAAQMVCIGHAANIFLGPGSTYLPHVGVLIFFVLSGFLIAHTLFTKAVEPGYGFAEFMIERIARIYSAYLPALFVIAIVDYLMWSIGLFPVSFSPVIFLKNLLMLQNYPGPFNLGGPTFGSAGQLSSLAAEFHIYVFVGAMFFMVSGRRRLTMLAIAILSAAMPLGYFLGISGTDRGLFVLWLLGFGSYFVARVTKMDRDSAIYAGVLFPLLCAYWYLKRDIGNEYDIQHYPVFLCAFFAMVLASQGSSWLTRSIALKKITTVFADYAFSLFLLHYTLVKVVNVCFPDSGVSGLVFSVVCANIISYVFAIATENKHRNLSQKLKAWLLGYHRKPKVLPP